MECRIWTLPRTSILHLFVFYQSVILVSCCRKICAVCSPFYLSTKIKFSKNERRYKSMKVHHETAFFLNGLGIQTHGDGVGGSGESAVGVSSSLGSLEWVQSHQSGDLHSIPSILKACTEATEDKEGQVREVRQPRSSGSGVDHLTQYCSVNIVVTMQHCYIHIGDNKSGSLSSLWGFPEFCMYLSFFWTLVKFSIKKIKSPSPNKSALFSTLKS